MEEALKRLGDREKAVGVVGSSVVQTEQLLRDLEALDTQARVSGADSQGRSVSAAGAADVCVLLRRRRPVHRW